MKRYCWIVLLLFFSVTYGQEPTRAKLVNDFGPIGCEFLLAKTESLYDLVAETPNTKAVVVIDGNRFAFERYRKQILVRFQFHDAEDRIVFLIGDTKADRSKISFWLVPDGVPLPEGTPWVEPKQDLSKPFIFGYADENGVCPSFAPRKFADLLKADPGSRANIVVFGGGRYSVRPRDFADEWVSELHDKYGISKKRIKVFFGKRSSDSLTHAEFWFVPAK